MTNKQLLIEICNSIGFNSQLIESPCRARIYVRAREIVAYSLYKNINISTTELGKLIGREHSTVSHLLNLYKEDYKYDKEFKALADRAQKRTKELVSSTKEETPKEHECSIGLLFGTYDQLVTWNDIVKYQKEYNIFSLFEYADQRYNVGMQRFNYCPFCGKKIDWEEFKSECVKDEIERQGKARDEYYKSFKKEIENGK